MWEEQFLIKGEYKKGKIEKSFQSEIMKLLRNMGFICYHIQDIGLANKFLDMFFIDNDGVCRFIEFKKIEKDTFNVSQFEDNQIVLLRELEKRNPNIARVYIYSVKNNDYISLKFSTIWDNRNDKGGIKLWDKGNLLFNFE